MDLQLTDRVVLVVGGNGTLGSVIVRRLEAEGAKVVSASRSGTGGLTLDASDDESVRAGFASVLAEHGRLDGVVITAAPPAKTLDAARHADPDQVREAIEGKSLTFLRVANAALEVMGEAGYGRIVGISGQNARLTGNVSAAVRNAALNVAAKTLADSVAGSGITVNTVNPGNVVAEPDPEIGAGKPGQSTPDDTANLVAFLLSPLTGGISGEAIALGHRVRGVAEL
ncbi:SDR family NAD(P)-dependent oxidoreductase [Gulosibacter sediminis]|uniref:SDR family NAD(P)-dependent oxidoreductase n=1 Tax=Gulosibacter sediminis TaxID=1729695 RepID=UPI0024A82F6A|nr:SDR family oxidoreductase [Gulosibacter sediminis]